MTHSDWFQRCCSRVPGQQRLFSQIISNYFEKYYAFPGLHSIILEGITGSGKTTIGRALVETCPFDSKYYDCISLFMNSKIGGPEKELAALFSVDKPHLLVLDHAECLLHQKSNETDELTISLQPHSLERKLYLLLRSLVDKLNRQTQIPFFLIVLLPNSLDLPAEIVRPGRLSRREMVSISSKQQRKEILELLLSNWNISDECIDILCGQPTSGFTVADLEGFLRRVQRLNKSVYKVQDFLSVRASIIPTSVTGRAGLKQKPVQLLAGLHSQQEQINRVLSGIFEGKKAPRGILLYGPSGCGKSLLASTLSSYSLSPDHQLPITFIAVDSASLLSKYFGESERNLAQVFADARAASPCILFLDQIDALAAKRRMSDESGSSDRLVTTFLVEMDGFARKSSQQDSHEDIVIVLATTNKRKELDPAILRPGRLDLHIELPLPGADERNDFVSKFLAQNKGFQLNEAEIKEIVDSTEDFSYADLDSMFREAALKALREDINCQLVNYSHFFH